MYMYECQPRQARYMYIYFKACKTNRDTNLQLKRLVKGGDIHVNALPPFVSLYIHVVSVYPAACREGSFDVGDTLYKPYSVQEDYIKSCTTPRYIYQRVGELSM